MQDNVTFIGKLSQICSLVRGSIAERSGVRVGHRIIDINGTSTVGMQHSDIVHLLSSTVGDVSWARARARVGLTSVHSGCTAGTCSV